MPYLGLDDEVVFCPKSKLNLSPKDREYWIRKTVLTEFYNKKAYLRPW